MQHMRQMLFDKCCILCCRQHCAFLHKVPLIPAYTPNFAPFGGPCQRALWLSRGRFYFCVREGCKRML
jgi:hypothetical protein